MSSAARPRHHRALGVLAAVAVSASLALAGGVRAGTAAGAAAADDPGTTASRQLVAEARAADSHCVTVVRDGRVVLDRDLAPGVRTTPAWSISKSVTALLVGIAQDRGMLDLDDRVARHVPAWRGTPSRRVRIRHLLANTSGRQWSQELDYDRMAGRAPDKTRFAIRLRQQHRPGRVWVYNNSAIQVLEAVLERATGTPVADFARTHLFGPLGMRRTEFRVDGAGNPMLFGGLVSTCPDLARLGAMLVDRGRAGGAGRGSGTRRIVSARFWREATQHPSQRHNAGYGLLFWINEPGPLLGSLPGPAGQGPMVPLAGEDAFWAIGLYQQYLFVSPSQRVVAVRLGDPPPGGTFSLGRFTELALAAR